MKSWRLYGVIPTGKAHSYVIILATGRRVKVTPSFKQEVQLGENIQRMWLHFRTVRAARDES